MAKRASASAAAETPTKTAHGKTALRPVSTVAVKEINKAKRPKVGAAKKKALKLDANRPKKPPTAFFYFLEDFRKEFQEQNPNVKSMREIGKACGEKWKIMTYEGALFFRTMLAEEGKKHLLEKVQYYDVATEKRAKFEKAMADYVKKKENGEHDEFNVDPDYEE